jgi:hypothetical protein
MSRQAPRSTKKKTTPSKDVVGKQKRGEGQRYKYVELNKASLTSSDP